MLGVRKAILPVALLRPELEVDDNGPLWFGPDSELVACRRIQLPQESLVAGRRRAPLWAQDRDGKMPSSAITKFTTRSGWMFECGWLPPVGDETAGAIGAPPPCVEA